MTSDLPRTEAAFSKVIAWAEAHPDASWEESAQNVLTTLSQELADMERELANCKRDLAAAEAKLAAKPDVARLVKEATTEALHQDARALTGADQSIAGALLRRLADALLSLSAQVKELEDALDKATHGRYSELMLRLADEVSSNRVDRREKVALAAQLKEKEAECAGLSGAFPSRARRASVL